MSVAPALLNQLKASLRLQELLGHLCQPSTQTAGRCFNLEQVYAQLTLDVHFPALERLPLDYLGAMEEDNCTPQTATSVNRFAKLL